MKGRKLFFLVLVLVLAIVFSGCSAVDYVKDFFKKDKNPIEIEEPINTGYPFYIGETEILQAPEKVACLSVSLVEQVDDLGFGDNISAAATGTTHPKWAQELPLCGSAMLPDVDIILESGADMVLTPYPIADNIAQQLEKRQVQVVEIPQPESLDQLYQSYETIGKIFLGNNDGAEHAAQLTDKMKGWLADAGNKGKEENQKVLYLRQLDYTVATGDTIVGELLKTVGFENIADRYTSWQYPEDELKEQENLESFKELDWIFIDGDEVDIKMLEQHSFYKSLPVVIEDRYVTVDYTAFETCSSRMFYQLSDILESCLTDSPDSFGDYSGLGEVETAENDDFGDDELTDPDADENITDDDELTDPE